MFLNNLTCLVLELVLIIISCIIRQLFSFHYDLIKTNQTTNENIKYLYENGSPYDRGFFSILENNRCREY